MQGQNFAVALDAWRGVHTFPTRSGQPNIVDTTNVGSHLFYNISFELLTLLSIRSRTLDQAGLLPTGFIITSVATLAELELIINVLQDELQFMHYVQTRIRIEALDGLVADELDIVAFYLLGCPKIEVLMSTPDVGMVLYGQSKLVDIAVVTEKNLSETNWPGTQRSALIQALIDDLRASGSVGWVHAGLSLLSIPYREQVVLDRILKQLENTV